MYGATLTEMRGSVRERKPNASPESIDTFLNDRVRSVVLCRDWVDLRRQGVLAIPDAVTTGLVSMTQGSPAVLGAGTGWNVADEINTTSAAAIQRPGFQLVKPASMTNIQPGKYLLIDLGQLNQEVVAVRDAGPGYFVASFAKTHTAGYTIVKSSLANRQFRTSFPVYTVTAVTSPTSLLLDNPWGNPDLPNAQYTILLMYVSPDPYARRILFAYDPVQGQYLDTETWTYADVLQSDPQMTAIQDPQMIVPGPAGPAGVALWWLYPAQNSARGIGVIYSTTWPRMVADNDGPPPFINPDVFVNGASADAMLTKNIPRDSGRPIDPYYDPVAADKYEKRFREYLELAENDDEGRNYKNLQSWANKLGGMAWDGNAGHYVQSHPTWTGVWP